MSNTHEFFRIPTLRAGVEVQSTDSGFTILYRRQSADLDVPDLARAEMGRLLEALSKGAPASQLTAQAPNLNGVDSLLDELDRLGLITEGAAPTPTHLWSGPELYRRIRRFARDLRIELGESSLYRGMIEGRATRSQLIGYAIEYHHVVRMSPALIAPAIAHAWEPDAFDILQRFLEDELGHDEMTRSALTAVGVPAESLRATEPLPSTFAVCATLGATAAQDPLSFAACLCLVEESQPEFNRVFAESAGDLGLPPDFVTPLLAHSGINEQGSHADVSRELFATVGCVGLEHEQAVLKQVSAMVESLARMDRDIVRHYEGPDVRLRIFEPSPVVPA